MAVHFSKPALLVEVNCIQNPKIKKLKTACFGTNHVVLLHSHLSCECCFSKICAAWWRDNLKLLIWNVVAYSLKYHIWFFMFYVLCTGNLLYKLTTDLTTKQLLS